MANNQTDAGSTRLPQVLNKHHAELLADWIAAQMSCTTLWAARPAPAGY